ncbi:hypothetical protein PCANC_18997 [Puccinia coronata f. sp. avenae]|uniref:Uncharacterized protein n=1 Tax=Puccinia coronata f. sp. avenae TaxID=200324 RepID=A0A2N5U3G7_9BASI|nr:hypothetical protein PCANC_18997 [Puccinia coronata f. sp. avenae]
MCAKAQQVLLDSHRAGVAEATGQNLVEDLVQSSDVTLLSVHTDDANLVRNSRCMEWGFNTENEYVALVRSERLTKDIVLRCLALSTSVGLSIYTEARIEQGATTVPVAQEHLFMQKYDGAARYGPKEAPLQIAHLVGLSDTASNMIVQCHVGQASWRSLSDMGLDRIV